MFLRSLETPLKTSSSCTSLRGRWRKMPMPKFVKGWHVLPHMVLWMRGIHLYDYAPKFP